MFEIRTLLIAIPALPLAAAVLCGLLGKHFFRGRSHAPVVLALALSFVASLELLFQVQRAAVPAAAEGIGFERVVTLWRWADVEEALPGTYADRSAAANEFRAERPFRIDVALRADPLTAIMLAIVTAISLLVAIYSIGYMRGDPGYWRFFAYIGLFVFSMTMLVSVSNFLLLYVFWEAVGLCSYLLIGFWFEKPAAAAAGKKAFLVNRVGDFGFALGLFLLWVAYGTLDFHDTAGGSGILGQDRLAAGGYLGGTVGTAIGLLLLLGACGKSAQFPLHVWLPDAMEGPTPVSALIHAATMVTAGVYMVVRCLPLLLASPQALEVVATVGGLTAAMAAIVALTQTDLKRILAYSTISQLGYMFLAVGAGTLLGATAAMFHLFTHAFFKALLFLGAGSVMHAMGGVIEIDRFGGLRRRLPTTHWTFLVGCLALASEFPFAGFWSKDLVLLAIDQRAADGGLYWWLYALAFVTALLTAFYAFRAYFLTFFGPERIPHEAGHHAHESPPLMTVPLVILALASILVGAYFEYTHGFANYLARTPSLAYPALVRAAHEASAEAHHRIMLQSAGVATAGVIAAAVFYLGGGSVAARAAGLMKAVGLYGLSQGKFFFDPLYNAVIVWPLAMSARFLAWMDQGLIDGAVNLLGRMPAAAASLLRPLQGGLLPFYALAMLAGLLALMGTLLL